MEKIPSRIERLLLPKLNEITGEIKAIHTRIDSVGKEVVSLRNETMAKFEAADAKVESFRKEAVDSNVASLRNEMISRFEAVNAKFEKVDARFDSLEVRIPAIEEITGFEARVLELEKKLAAV